MLELKNIDAVSFYICEDGKIGIKQYSYEHGNYVYINITIDQFRKFERWVTFNELDIAESWNEGVEDDSKA